jgi:hypothetical protein
MNTIRFFAGLLLVFNGMLHIYGYLDMPGTPGRNGILAFGVIYILTGILLFNKKLYPVYLGLVIPVIGMTLSIIKFGVPELVSLSALFKLLGVIVIICCVYMLVRRRKLNPSAL